MASGTRYTIGMTSHKNRSGRASLLQTIWLVLWLIVVGSAQAQDGQVKTDGVVIHAGPADHFPILGELQADTEVALIGRSADGAWLLVRKEYQAGWVDAQAVDLIAEFALEETSVVP